MRRSAWTSPKPRHLIQPGEEAAPTQPQSRDQSIPQRLACTDAIDASPRGAGHPRPPPPTQAARGPAGPAPDRDAGSRRGCRRCPGRGHHRRTRHRRRSHRRTDDRTADCRPARLRRGDHPSPAARGGGVRAVHHGPPHWGGGTDPHRGRIAQRPSRIPAGLDALQGDAVDRRRLGRTGRERAHRTELVRDGPRHVGLGLVRPASRRRTRVRVDDASGHRDQCPRDRPGLSLAGRRCGV